MPNGILRGMNGCASQNPLRNAAYIGDSREDAHGLPVFTRLAEALAGGYSHLSIGPGVYHEKLTVSHDDVVLCGEDPGNTIITFDDAHGTLGVDGKPLGTGGSATVTISGARFTAHGITFANGFDYLAHARHHTDDPARLSGLQAVALRTVEGSDCAHFTNCHFTGYQDTLFINSGRHYFKDCTVTGNIDFIFGAGTAVFEDCAIISRDRQDAVENGFIVAPSTKGYQPFGMLFLHCRLERELLCMAAHSVWLGRPWHPAGDPEAVPSACFLSCTMDDHIRKEGWTSMHSRTKEGLCATWYPWQSRFYESDTQGPGGAQASATRTILSPEDASRWNRDTMLAPWNVLMDQSTQ